MDRRPVRARCRWAPVVGAAIPIVGALGWLVAVVRARPSLGETALAVDAEGRLGDRVSSALELAVGVPGLGRPGRPTTRPTSDGSAPTAHVDEAAETDRFVRRQRADAVASLRAAPAEPVPAAVLDAGRRSPLVVAALLLAPVLLLPNPQDAVIAQQRQVQEAANRQAERLDDLAEELERRARTPTIRGRSSPQELRDLARQLRDQPDQLDVNLARLGSIEDDVRAQIDPANEQRAASLDLAEPRALAGRDRQARREQGRRSRSRRRRTSTSSATSSTR